MYRLLKLTIVLAVASIGRAEAQSAKSLAELQQEFVDLRFGMFIHYNTATYLSDDWADPGAPPSIFNPTALDCGQWAKVAGEANMSYGCLTAKHHNGFCIWDTKTTDYSVMSTPCKRDVVREYVDAFRDQGLKVMLYYSILDLHHNLRPGWVDSRHVEMVKAQLTELLTDYGDVAVIWFDGHWDQTADENRTNHSAAVDWHYDEIYGLIRKLQPNCLIANNHHLPTFPGEDYQIFERDVPGENKSGYSGQEVSRLPLETCETINGSWGYNITDNRYKPASQLIQLLVRTAGTGANLLLNVGPMPDGRIDETSTSRLREMGEWLGKWGYTVYGTTAGFIKPQDWGAVTRKGDKYYIHIMNAPGSGALALEIPGFASAKWLNMPGDLRWSHDRKSGYTTIVLDGVTLDPVDSIIEVTVK